MTTKIVLSAAAIRARIQSLIALQASLSTDDRRVLTPDRDAAVNQQLVFNFLQALMRVAPAVADFTVEPAEYYENHDVELMLQAEIKAHSPLEAKQARVLLENYVTEMTLASLLSEGYPEEAAAYRSGATAQLDSFVETLAARDLASVRISRTI